MASEKMHGIQLKRDELSHLCSTISSSILALICSIAIHRLECDAIQNVGIFEDIFINGRSVERSERVDKAERSE